MTHPRPSQQLRFQSTFYVILPTVLFAAVLVGCPTTPPITSGGPPPLARALPTKASPTGASTTGASTTGTSPTHEAAFNHQVPPPPAPLAPEDIATSKKIARMILEAFAGKRAPASIAVKALQQNQPTLSTPLILGTILKIANEDKTGACKDVAAAPQASRNQDWQLHNALRDLACGSGTSARNGRSAYLHGLLLAVHGTSGHQAALARFDQALKEDSGFDAVLRTKAFVQFAAGQKAQACKTMKDFVKSRQIPSHRASLLLGPVCPSQNAE